MEATEQDLGPPVEAPRNDLGPRGTSFLAALLVFVVALAWWELLAIPLVGEDYVILGRVRDGGPAYAHVFRPLAGLWIELLHGAFGADSSVPYHVAAIALQAADSILVFAVAACLFGRRGPAFVAAVAYAVGALATDSLSWTANVTRPISTFWFLIAAWGLVSWRARPRRAAALFAVGFVAQALANEEAYGTALLAIAWLALVAARPGHAAAADTVRKSAVTAAALTAVAMALHFLFLQHTPQGAEQILADGLAQAPASAWGRASDICAGLGLGFPGAGALPALLLIPLILAGRGGTAVFLALAYLASFVPFILEPPVEYRAFATLAPNALIFGGAVHGVVLLARGGRGVEPAIVAIASVLLLLGSAGPRSERIARWYEITREIDAVDGLLEARGWPVGTTPTLVNLDTSTAAVVAYRMRLDDVTRIAMLGFLDGASGFVSPLGEASPDAYPEPWIGRRVDGSIGLIDPATYFGERAILPEFRLVGRLHEAADLEAARVLLADPDVRLAEEAVAETDVAALGPRAARGEIREVEPFDADPVAITARMVLEVRAEEDTVLAVCPTWQYAHGMRFALDQTLYSDVTMTRILRLTARIDGGEPREAFFLDLYGFGVPVPAGTHTVELDWRRAMPAEIQ